MKRSFTKFLVLSGIAVMMLASCKKDETKVVANTSQAKSTFAASTTNPVLSKANLDGQAVAFTIKSPDYGFKAATSNSIQISTDDFATIPNTKEVSLDLKATSKAFNVLDFNNILLGLNLPTGVATTVKARLKTQFTGSVVTPTYSDAVSLNVTPFPLTSFIYLAGAYEDWAVPSVNVDSLLSATSNGIYTGIINFPAGKLEFKVLPTNKNYDGNLGSGGPGKIVENTQTNIAAPAAGLTWVTVDMNNKTIAFEPVKYYYSLIGAASPSGNWDNDTDLKYDNGNQVWQGTFNLTAGEMKVRRNHDWSTSYGPPKKGADGATLATSDTDNIPVAAAGTYHFTFALDPADITNSKATYTLVKKK